MAKKHKLEGVGVGVGGGALVCDFNFKYFHWYIPSLAYLPGRMVEISEVLGLIWGLGGEFRGGFWGVGGGGRWWTLQHDHRDKPGGVWGLWLWFVISVYNPYDFNNINQLFNLLFFYCIKPSFLYRTFP